MLKPFEQWIAERIKSTDCENLQKYNGRDCIEVGTKFPCKVCADYLALCAEYNALERAQEKEQRNGK